MSSQRSKIDNNPNDSKNTRMSIEGLVLGDARTDILAHLSRYNKVAELILKESRQLKRPIDILDVGCGELYPMRVLYKAHVCKKSEVVASYLGVDIDDPMLAKQEKQCKAMLDIFNGSLICQDVTTNPAFPQDDESIDFAYSCEVIEHMQPQFVSAWLDDMDRVLRPGGLLYFSTPNHDGSNDRLPLDHVYEWRYDELREQLTKRWSLFDHTGTFIKLPTFERENRIHKRIPEELVETLKARFDHFWLRNMLAAPYPEFANNVAWILRKELK